MTDFDLVKHASIYKEDEHSAERNCEHCIHALCTDKDKMLCTNENIDTPKFVFLFSGCNRFEGKTDGNVWQRR